MKEIKCYECDEVFEAESRDEMLKKLYEHYMEAHKDVILNATDEEKKTWMAKFDKDWQSA